VRLAVRRLKRQDTLNSRSRISSTHMEVLLSFNYDDCHLAEALRATLFMLEPNLDVMEVILSPLVMEQSISRKT
jgi:hypothetical protein